MDLLVNENSQKIFKKRAKIISTIRDFLVDREFLEVETPMMQPVPGREKMVKICFVLNIYRRTQSPEPDPLILCPKAEQLLGPSSRIIIRSRGTYSSVFRLNCI